jgi:hypothetical protein
MVEHDLNKTGYDESFWNPTDELIVPPHSHYADPPKELAYYAAAADFCRLLGDADRLLWKAEIAWAKCDEDDRGWLSRVFGKVKNRVIPAGRHDGQAYHELFPSSEASKCRVLRREIRKYIDKYTDVLGRNQGLP